MKSEHPRIWRLLSWTHSDITDETDAQNSDAGFTQEIS